MSGLLRERPSGSYIVETSAQFASVGFLYGYTSAAFRETAAVGPAGATKAEIKVAHRQMSSRKWARVGRVTGLFTAVGLTYAGVKCAVSELRGTKQHDPVSSLVGGMAAGAVAMIPRGNPAYMAGCSLVFGVGSMLLAFQLEGSNSLMLYQTGKNIRGLRNEKSESQ